MVVQGYGAGAAYWDTHYRDNPKPFEWLKHFKQVAGLLEEATGGDRQCHVLHVGCGNSMIAEGLYDCGYRNILNTDTSSVAIELMSDRNGDKRPGMRWELMDAMQMSLGDCEFGLVIDKALLDTIGCTPDGRAESMRAYLGEVWRVLRPGGVFLCITLHGPCDRLDLLASAGFAVSVREFSALQSGSGVHYTFFCIKEISQRAEELCARREFCPTPFCLSDLD